ncbi:peptidoglycan recognition protein family protein [Photobacterium nomapromontoriensis]|uniref:peptidoglycan recognition protein family protein n=1 Tax=Photobacterium nomapromontoriensis TaxID=2910237 RepID=UPI003D0C6AF3
MTFKHNEEIVFTKLSRHVHTVFLHCSASDNPSHDSISTIRKWHLKRGFNEVGYHFFISKNGDIHLGRSLEKTPAAQKGHNTGSIAICLHGLKKEKFTEKQISSVKKLCSVINNEYSGKMKFRGHCEVSSKSCPVFDYKSTLKLDEDHLINNSITNTQFITKGRIAIAHNILELFSTGNKVIEIQKVLFESGYFTKIDGIYGQATKASVEAFQRDNKLKIDGIVGPKTIEIMGTLRLGSIGTAVKLLQSQLKIKGYKEVINGKFEHKTDKNVKAFQTSNNLKPDGIVGKKTKQKLFGTIKSQKQY